ncbi:hypothetical protein ACIA8R_19565 [Nonomuraea sp. NPDC051191]|uniref:hypothetical protein n=1 Tax=Nonomuraea sp. NPDC051191 TaxID=3364372 RepID=UPI00379BF3EA
MRENTVVREFLDRYARALLAETAHSAWADVTRHHEGSATERHLCHLIDTVPPLTPLGR